VWEKKCNFKYFYHLGYQLLDSFWTVKSIKLEIKIWIHKKLDKKFKKKFYSFNYYLVEDVAKLSTNKLSTFYFFNFYFTTFFNPIQGPLQVSLHFELSSLNSNYYSNSITIQTVTIT